MSPPGSRGDARPHAPCNCGLPPPPTPPPLPPRAAVDYLTVPEQVRRQREAILAQVAARPPASTVYPPLNWDAVDASSSGGPRDPEFYLRNLASIPGLVAAGYQPEGIVTRRRETDLVALGRLLTGFTDQLLGHDDSWPFREPVDLSVVPDYTQVVREPIGASAGGLLRRGAAGCKAPCASSGGRVQAGGVRAPLPHPRKAHPLPRPVAPPLPSTADLGTLRANASSAKYRSLEHYLGDLDRVFSNCRKYKWVRPDTRRWAWGTGRHSVGTARPPPRAAHSVCERTTRPQPPPAPPPRYLRPPRDAAAPIPSMSRAPTSSTRLSSRARRSWSRRSACRSRLQPAPAPARRPRSSRR